MIFVAKPPESLATRDHIEHEGVFFEFLVFLRGEMFGWLATKAHREHKD